MSNMDEIKKLRDAITPLPWEWQRWPCETKEQLMGWFEESVEKGEGFKLQLVGANDEKGECLVAITGNGPRSEANALFIRAAPEIVDHLLSSLSESQATVGRMRRTLERIADPQCGCRPKCTCLEPRSLEIFREWARDEAQEALSPGGEGE